MTLAHNPCVLVIESDENLANQLACDLKEAGYDP
ncbi:MAG: DNA-binding response regulator, partial [Brasilonema sp.]